MKIFSDMRIYLLIVPALIVLALVDMPVTMTLLFSLTAIFVMVGICHLIRKALFPYIDLEIAVNHAETDPIAAAILFFSVVLFFCTVLTCTIMWVRG